MQRKNSIKIANTVLRIKSSTNEKNIEPSLAFSPLFEKFYMTSKLKNSFFEIDLNFSSKIESYENFINENPLLKAPSLNIYQKKNDLFFAISPESSPEKGEQFLKICKDQNKASIYLKKKSKLKQVFYPLDQLLFQWAFIKSNSFMMHGCAFKVDKKGFIALGESGSGKTTLIKTLEKKSSQVTLLNDERNVIWKNSDNKYFISPTPWHGELPEINNKTASLNYIFFIEKRCDNFIKPINFIDAYVKTLKTCFMPFWDKQEMTSYSEELEKMLFENKEKLFLISYDKESDLYSKIKDFIKNA